MAKFLVEILINAAGEPQARAAFDSVGASAAASGKKVETSSVAAEASLRKLTDAATKLQSQMSDTAKSKGFVADMTALNAKLADQITAWKGGAEGIAKWTEKTREAAVAQQILAAQVRAGVSAQSDAGKAIAAQITQYNKLTSELAKVKAESGAKGGAGSGGLLDSLLGRIGGATGEGGAIVSEFAAKIVGLGETFDGLVEKSGGVGKAVSAMLEPFAELGPILAEVAVAAVAVGVAWKGFEFIGEALKEGMAAYAVVTQLNNVLKQNGTTTGLSAREMQEYAESLVAVTGRDDDLILKMESTLARFDKLNEEGFKKATRLALDYSQATGKDAVESTSLVGKALEGSTKSFGALADMGIVLTKAQKATLQQMVETGNVAGYQAIVFKLLTDKVGGAAEAFSRTLAGDIAIAHTVMSEFQKGIASELIPALETLVNDLVGSQGGWLVIRAAAGDAGRDVGNVIRTMVYGVGVGFHEWIADAYILKAEFLATMLAIVDGSLGLVGKFASGMGKLPGFLGASYRDAAKEITGIQAVLSVALGAQVDDARKHVGEEVAAIAGLTIAYNEHRQALEADDKVHGKVGASTDVVGKKFKDLESIIATVKKTLQEYADKIADIETKQRHETGAAQELSDALDLGLLAYKQEEVRQQRSAAITAVLTEAYKLHRTEIEQLTAEQVKATQAGQTAEAARIASKIDDETRKYADQAAQLAINAGRTFDLTNANKLRAQGEQDLLNLQNQLALDEAKLVDLKSRDSEATRGVTAEQARQKDILSLLSPETRKQLDDLRASIDLNKQATIEQSALNAALDNTANVRASVADWEQQRAAVTTYGASIAGILKQYGLLDTATQQRQIDEKVLAAQQQGMDDTRAAALRAQLQEQQDVVNGLRLIQAQTEIDEKVYKDFADSLAGNFATIFGNFVKGEQVTLNTFRDAVVQTFASILESQIKEWLTQWFEAMAQWLARWIATQAAAKAASAAAGSGGDGAGTSYGDMAASMAGTAATSGAGSSVGGVSGLFSGSGSLGAAGSVGAWVAVLAVFGMAVNALNAHMQKTEEDVIDFQKSLNVYTTSGGAHVAGLVAAGQALAAQVQTFFNSFGSIFQSLDSSIAIKRRGQGSNTEWKVYVDGAVTNFGKDYQAALDYATIQTIKHSSQVGMSPLVVSAIQDYVGTSLDEFKTQVEFAQRIATQNLPGIAGQVSAAATQYYSDLTQAQKQFAGDLPALNAAVQSIVQKFNDTVQGIKNAALGIDTSTSDFLAGLVGFQTQAASTSATVASTIQKMIDDTQAQITSLLTKGPGHTGSGGRTGGVGDAPGGSDGTGGGDTSGGHGRGSEASSVDLEWNKQLADLQAKVKEYQDELAKIPKALSDTEVNMAVFNSLYTYLQGSAKYAAQAAEYAKMKVDIEFASIKLQLIALGKWEEFAGMWQDALTAAEKDAINKARSRPSSSAPSGPTLADLRAQIASMQAEAAGAVHKSFYDLTVSIADFTKNAKQAKLPAAELATAIALMTQKFQDGLRTQAQAYAGVGTDFTSRLKGVVDFFHELETLGRTKTGMPNWLERLLKGEALAKLGSELTASIDAFNGLTDPMVAINAQADTLRQNVEAYGKAAGWTADQIQAALDKINAGVDYQRESALNGVMDTLFGYLKDDSRYAQQAADLKKKEVDLQFRIIEAQLKALDAWDAATQQLFDDAKKAAEDAASGVAQQAAFDYAQAVIQDRNMVNAAGDAAVQTWRQAVQSFTQQTQAVITNPALTGLTQDQQYQAALSNFEALRAKAQGGDAAALSQLDQARQTALTQAHAEYGGGAGFQEIYQRIMGESAGLLANAQQTEATVFANAMATQTQTQTNALTTAIYGAATQVAAAIYAGFAGIPHYAEGGIATRPHVALIGERGPEAIVPLNRQVVYPTPGGGARILAFHQSGGGGGAGVGGGGTAHDLAAAVGRLATSQARMAGDLRSIAETSARTARSNESMQRADRIRAVVNRRTG